MGLFSARLTKRLENLKAEAADLAADAADESQAIENMIADMSARLLEADGVGAAAARIVNAAQPRDPGFGAGAFGVGGE